MEFIGTRCSISADFRAPQLFGSEYCAQLKVKYFKLKLEETGQVEPASAKVKFGFISSKIK